MKPRNPLLRPALAAVSALALLAVSGLRADDTITVNWTSTTATAKNIVGLNGWSAHESGIASNSSYKSSLGAIYPSLFRIHAAEMMNPSTHPKSWLNADGLTWNANKIKSIIGNVSPHVNEIMINIPRWPAAMAPTNAKLPAAKWGEFAAFCASLVDIARVQTGNTKVVYFEVLNEVDGFYNGSADMTELMNLVNQCRTAMRAKSTAIKIVPAAWTQPYDSDFATFITKFNKDIHAAAAYHNYSTSGTTTDLNTLYNNSEYIGTKANDIRNKLNALSNGSAIKLFIDETNTYAVWSDDSQSYMRSNEGAVTVALTWRGCMNSLVGGKISTDNLTIWNDADNIYGAMNAANGYALRHTGRMLKELRERFSAGYVRSTSSSTSSLRPIAVTNGTQRSLMIINRDTANARTVDFTFQNGAPANGATCTLIRLDDNGINTTTFAWNGNPQNIVLQKNSVNFLYCQ